MRLTDKQLSQHMIKDLGVDPHLVKDALAHGELASFFESVVACAPRRYAKQPVIDSHFSGFPDLIEVSEGAWCTSCRLYYEGSNPEDASECGHGLEHRVSATVRVLSTDLQALSAKDLNAATQETT